MKQIFLLLVVLIGSIAMSYGQKERNMILPEKRRSVKLNNYDVLKDSNNVHVFVKVLVSPNGKVQQAVLDLERSTTDDAELIGISLKSAYEALFDPSFTTNNQWGSISFTYRLGSMTDHKTKMVEVEKSVNERAQGFWQSMKDDAGQLFISGSSWIFIHNDDGKKEDIEYSIDLDASNDEKVILKTKRNKTEVFEVLGLNDQYLSLLHLETGAINNYKKAIR